MPRIIAGAVRTIELEQMEKTGGTWRTGSGNMCFAAYRLMPKPSFELNLSLDIGFSRKGVLQTSSIMTKGEKGIRITFKFR